MSRDLLIYHQGTGTLIPLSDIVFLVDASRITEETLDLMEMGLTVSDNQHLGVRIDNYNMTNLFFGGAE